VRYLFALLLCTLTVSLNAQITGQVKDFRTGLPIAKAQIFTANGLSSTVSDSKGFFTLEGLQHGQIQIGCTLSGYGTIFQQVTASSQGGSILFILKKEKGKKLTDEVLKSTIEESLLAQSNVIPEWARSFQRTRTELKVEEVKPGEKRIYGEIGIKNQLLGYDVTLYLQNYSQTKPEYYLRFYPMSGSAELLKNWEETRFVAYQVSKNNFLESVLQGTSELNGYSVSDVGNQKVRLEEWLHIGFSGQPNLIRLNKTIKVVQRLNDKKYESEWTAGSRILFDDQGALLNADSVLITGAMANLDVGIKLPIEYTPSAERKIFNLDQYFEKAYVHTDKSYYYPGDTLWFRAYMNYQTLALIESLSKVLHVELLDAYQGGRIIASKQIKIEDGEAWGEFILPDSLPSDFIALRAYTNWQRNFGTDQIFVKYLPYLKGNLNLESTRNELIVNDNVRIKTNKKSYYKRDLIQMSVGVINDKQEPISAWMSVSVTDQSMVRSLQDSINILETYTIKPFPPTRKLLFPLEKGLELRGRYLDISKKPSPVNLMVASTSLGSFRFDTDISGAFGINGLDFTDSVTVNFTANNGKRDLEGGSIELFKHDSLPLANLHWPKLLENVQPADYKIDKHATMLKDVVIRAKRQRIISDKTRQEEAIRKTRPFGEPDYVLDETKLNYSLPNVIEMMRGKVPGLQIAFDGASYQIKSARSGSFSLSTDPLVVIDNIQMSGSAVTNLLSLNQANVASIEIILRITALAGAGGRNGIILVYTKAGGLRGRSAEYETVHKVRVRGYSSPMPFKGIDHSDNFLPLNSDFRPTLYWNPSVVSSAKYGNASFSFYASDSTGPYLITIEGVTAAGKSFRHEQIIEIQP
jgi:hypothetical protein